MSLSSTWPFHRDRRADRSPVARSRTVIATLASTCVVLGLFTAGAPPALAAPPATATLVSPPNGSTTSAEPTLSVTASDPDGGPLDVTFEGRRQGAVVPGPAADPFTLVVLPDTQNYTYSNRQGTIAQQAQWVVNTRATLNTAMAVQLGDLVSEEENLVQWGHVSNGLKVMDDAGMPNTVLPGNHDFDNVTETFAEYNTYFPPSRYVNAPWTPATTRYGGYLGQSQFGTDPVDRKNMNNYALFTAGGRDFIVLNFEFEPPAYVYDWADRVLDAHPDRIAIVATHSYVSINGQLRTTTTRTNGTSPATMWSQFVSTHCQIQLVVSGHEHNGEASEARRTDTNSCGQPVQGILTDYQDRANGGDGWLRYYTFDPAANTMQATTYSPKLNQYETDANSSFTLPFDLGSAQPAPFAPIATKTVTSGGTASTTWSGLLPDTVYEWRAVTRDGTGSTTSATWTLRTPPAGVAIEDTFTRTSASGWGSTDTGQLWTVSSSTALTVSGGAGRLAAPAGTGRWARLGTVSALDTTISADVSVLPGATGSGTYVSVLSRLTNGTSYRAKLQFGAGGALTAFITRFGTTEVTLATQRLNGVTLTAGQPVRLVLESTGTSPTTLRLKAWPAAAPEPGAWTLTTTDSTATQQGAGSVGVETYVSSSAGAPSTVAFDRLVVTAPGVTPPPNQLPTAVIGTPTVTGRTVGLSGSGSSDPDGTIAGHAWQLGDGATGSGASTSHTYAADGTYTVRLTVTDDDGGTGTVTRQVTVAETPQNDAVAADDFGRTIAAGWGAADLGGNWTLLGSSTPYSVAGGVGTQRSVTPGSTLDASLRSVSRVASTLSLSVRWDRTAAGGTIYTSIVGRAPTASSDYRLKVVIGSNNVPMLDLMRRVGGAETLLARTTLTGTTLVANQWYSIRLQLTPSGASTNLGARMWVRGTAEPATWQVTAVDSTAALQSAGWLGVATYLSSSATQPIGTSYDDLRLTSP